MFAGSGRGHEAGVQAVMSPAVKSGNRTPALRDISKSLLTTDHLSGSLPHFIPEPIPHPLGIFG